MKVGFVCGAFDLLHAGHILMFRECKEYCDYLIVGLQVDPSIDRSKKSKPTQSILERQIQLLGTKYVDRILVYETEHDLKNLLAVFKIDVRFLGMDYMSHPENITAENAVPIKYLNRNHDYSTTELKERIRNGKS